MECYQLLEAEKIYNSDEMEKFIKENLSNLTHNRIQNVSVCVNIKYIKVDFFLIFTWTHTRNSHLGDFCVNSTKRFKKTRWKELVKC